MSTGSLKWVAGHSVTKPPLGLLYCFCTDLSGKMEAQILADLYNQIYAKDKRGKKDCLIELADTLSKIAGRKRPWTWRFLYSLLRGDRGFSISPELERAIQVAGARLDGQPEIQARSRAITVFTVNGIEPNSIVFGHTVLCYCQKRVVFNHPGRKYCFEECRRRAERERKAKRGSI